MAVQTPDPDADPSQRRYRGCSRIADYEITGKLGEGTFGVVSKGVSRRTGAIVALKKILIHNDKEGFPITALREIKLLKLLSHPNVLRLDEMAVERKVGEGQKRADIYMITPYMDHDLSGMTTNPDITFTIPQIKCYMLQLLEGLRYLHDSRILHRDMKAANILISNKGQLQIADFGLARHYEGSRPRSGMGNGEAVRDYTTLVVTRWYRPPELLLQLRRYTPAIDMWGAGCVFAELFECKPILEGKTDVNQAELIFELLGSPTEENMPGWSQLPGCEGVRQWAPKRGTIRSRFESRLGEQGINLLQNLLTLDWRKRINAMDALQHPYFTTPPLPAKPGNLPTYEDSHELDRRKHHERKTLLPPAPAGGTVGMDESYNARNRVNGDFGPLHQDYGRHANAPRDNRDNRMPQSHPLPAKPPNARTADDRSAGNRPTDDRRHAWSRSATDDRYNATRGNGPRNPGNDMYDDKSRGAPNTTGPPVDTYRPSATSKRDAYREDSRGDSTRPRYRDRDAPGNPGREGERDRNFRARSRSPIDARDHRRGSSPGRSRQGIDLSREKRSTPPRVDPKENVDNGSQEKDRKNGRYRDGDGYRDDRSRGYYDDRSRGYDRSNHRDDDRTYRDRDHKR